jgi:hypothetical protein
MKEYPKINTIFKRDMSSPKKTLLEGQFSLTEFEYLAHNEWLFTEKVDGTNIRVMYQDNAITFGGKTDNAQIPAALFKVLQEHFLPKQKLFEEKFPSGVCLYGEGFGAKIQKNGGLYRPDQAFVLFDVKVGDWWLERHNVMDIAESFSLDVVPIVGHGSLYDAINAVKVGMKSTWGDFMAEGIVARPMVELRTRLGDRIITKIKHRDFIAL